MRAIFVGIGCEADQLLSIPKIDGSNPIIGLF